jgi:SAM-dependent methyltransferase
VDGFNRHPRAGWAWWCGKWPCPGSFKRSDRFFSRKAWRDLYRRHGGPGRAQFEIAKRLGAPGHLIGFDKDPAALEIAQPKSFSQSMVVQSFVVSESGGMTNGRFGLAVITLLHGSFAELANDQRPATVSTASWRILASAACSWATRRADLVFRRKDRWTCG